MSENPTTTEPKDGEQSAEGQTFTQDDVNRLVAKARSEERRKATEKYADYDDVKARADGAKTLEDRVAEIERQAKDSEARALRAEVANAKGLTPGQAKRLVGSTKEELEADASQLLADIGEQRSNGNHVPDEGTNPTPSGDDTRGFVRELFGRANTD